MLISMTKGKNHKPEQVINAILKLYDIIIKPINEETIEYLRPASMKLENLNDFKKIDMKDKEKIPKLNIKRVYTNNIQLITKNHKKGVTMQFHQIKKNSSNFISQNKMNKIDFNKFVNLYNYLITQIFKNKTGEYNLKEINKIALMIDFNDIYLKPKITEDMIRSSQFLSELKGILYKKLNEVINNSNNINICSKSKGVNYKYTIQKGNNSLLLKSIFKQRWWWINNDDILNSNILWSQWKNSDFIDKLPFLKKLTNKNEVSIINPLEQRICNHLENNFVLGNKKCLFLNIKNYYKLIQKDFKDIIPLTFHIKSIDDAEWKNFVRVFEDMSLLNKKNINIKSNSDQFTDNNKSHNIWIVKPGENSNRGTGIKIFNDLNSIMQEIKRKNSHSHTIILQKYIEYPLLFNSRKFDIRCFGLLTSINGLLKGHIIKAISIRKDILELHQKFFH